MDTPLLMLTGINSLALLGVAFSAGQWVRTISNTERRVENIELHGSPVIGRMEERLTELKTRLDEKTAALSKTLEAMEKQLAEVRAIMLHLKEAE